jgi:outer membrane protein assembly factor BamE (lipoprotein component of BamABCDE complex)
MGSKLGISIVVACLCILILFVIVQHKPKGPGLPSDVLAASREFKAHEPAFRDSSAEKLLPYIKTGMSREGVETLLGEPDDQKTGGENHISYYVGLSRIIEIDFDEAGNAIRVTGIDDRYLNHYELTWPLIRAGKTREYVLDHLGEAASESADGKRWDYVADGRTYTVVFDEQGLVESVEPPHAELEREINERIEGSKKGTPNM